MADYTTLAKMHVEYLESSRFERARERSEPSPDDE